MRCTAWLKRRLLSAEMVIRKCRSHHAKKNNRAKCHAKTNTTKAHSQKNRTSKANQQNSIKETTFIQGKNRTKSQRKQPPPAPDLFYSIAGGEDGCFSLQDPLAGWFSGQLHLVQSLEAWRVKPWRTHRAVAVAAFLMIFCLLWSLPIFWVAFLSRT